MEESKVVNGWYRGTDGGLYLTDEAKAESKAMYYNRRLAYDPQDTRHSVGVYNEYGEVVPYNVWPESQSRTVDSNGQ